MSNFVTLRWEILPAAGSGIPSADALLPPIASGLIRVDADLPNFPTAPSFGTPIIVPATDVAATYLLAMEVFGYCFWAVAFGTAQKPPQLPEEISPAADVYPTVLIPPGLSEFRSREFRIVKPGMRFVARPVFLPYGATPNAGP